MRAEESDHAVAQPRQCGGRIDLRQADFDVLESDAPAAGDVRLVILSGKEIAKPVRQRLLEPLDLGRAASDDTSSRGVPLDFSVEVFDESGKVWRQQFPGDDYTLQVCFRPSDVALQVLIAREHVRKPRRLASFFVWPDRVASLARGIGEFSIGDGIFFQKPIEPAAIDAEGSGGLRLVACFAS